MPELESRLQEPKAFIHGEYKSGKGTLYFIGKTRNSKTCEVRDHIGLLHHYILLPGAGPGTERHIRKTSES